MPGRPWYLGAALAAVLAGPPAFAAQSPQPAQPQEPTQQSQQQQPAIDPQASQLLRQMSDYLGNLKSFTFTANSVDEAVTTDGQKLQFLASQNVAVQRPNKLRSERVGPNADTIFRYDGQNFSLYGKRTGYYATAPAPAQLDAAIDDARARYHIDAPGADLLSSNLYEQLMDGVTSARYVGAETIEGMTCHHLAFRGQDVDWQIWIQDGAQPVPCRYQITTKNVTAQPEFAVNISNWQTQAKLSDNDFAFKPPPGAKKIDLQTAPVPKP